MLEIAADLYGVNTNPVSFEELAVSLANISHCLYQKEDGLERILSDFHRLYEKTLQHPPNYSEITEFAGHGLSVADRRSGRAAWLLARLFGLDVYAVHAKVWHREGDRFFAPLLDQVSAVVGASPSLQIQQLQEAASETSPLDVLGFVGNEVWLVQALSESKQIASAFSDSGWLFKKGVFQRPELAGKPRRTLFAAAHLIRQAFPDLRTRTFVLVIHRKMHDYELYEVPHNACNGKTLTLTGEMVVANSLEVQADLRQDCEFLWTLPERLDNANFIGIPPCRGGRTLNILGALGRLQLESSDTLLTWKEREVSDVLRDVFRYVVPRDKVRHDLVDRLVGQGFMRKWGSKYYLSVSGMARYLYCLEKYTSKGLGDSKAVLRECVAHRERTHGMRC